MATEDVLDRLVEVLKEDAQSRTTQLVELNEQLERRNQLLEQQMEQRQKTLEDKAKGPVWYSGAVAVVAIVIGAWVFTLIFQMMDDMNNMSNKMSDMQLYMKNMGEGDRPDGEQSYMASMAKNMNQMSGDMLDMKVVMTESVGYMNHSVGRMARDTDYMGKPFKAMDDFIPW